MLLRTIFSATIALLLSDCSVKTTGTLTGENNMHEKTGTYSGILPCASCPGIQTSITLNENGIYNLSRTYLDKDSTAFTEKGTIFETNKPAILVLKNETKEKTYISLENSHIRMLNTKGKEIKGELANHYILKKETSSQTKQDISQITENKWKLKSINGFSENQLKQYPQLPTMAFDADKERISGFAGCNNYFGNYQIKEPGKIRISQLSSTKKMCINAMELEDAFIKALDECEWILIEDKILNIKDKSENVLASFVAL